MYSSNLFPPIFSSSYMPAFIYNQTCKVYFSFSEYNSLSSLHHNGSTVDGIQVSVRNQKTNQSVLNTTNYPSQIKLTTLQMDPSGNYYIQISNNDIQGGFNLNEYYKVQIRLTGNQASAVPGSSAGIDTWLSNNLIYFSEWSRVVLIRGISTPTLTLTSLGTITGGIATLHTTDVDIIGSISFANSNDDEKLESYTIEVYNSSNALLENSGILFSENNEINYSIKTNLTIGNDYIVKIQIQTINLYSWDSPYSVTCTIADDDEPQIDMTVRYVVSNQTGNIKFDFINKTSGSHKITQNCKLLIKRTSSKDNFGIWENLYSCIITQNTFADIIWTDNTLQPGVWYKYNIIKYNSSGNREASFQINKAFMVDSQDILLNADGKQLIIRFDPQINGYSIKTSESTTETIGSQYPYIRENGKVKYRSFSLSGTITCLMDIGYNLLEASKTDLYQSTKSFYDTYNSTNNINIYQDYIYERDFREKVIEFLYKNNVKLFRSLTQGNMLVKLTNITLNPIQSLSRRIYSFSCNVTQIDACNGQNYKKYNILNNYKTVNGGTVIEEQFEEEINPLYG